MFAGNQRLNNIYGNPPEKFYEVVHKYEKEPEALHYNLKENCVCNRFIFLVLFIKNKNKI